MEVITMENDIISRIKLIRKELNLSQAAFAEKLGYTRGKIENIELGRVEPNKLFLQQISQVYKVDKDWLETGEGEMFVQKDSVSSLFDFATQLFLNQDLAWVRCLCEYVSQLTPEEQAAAARHIESLAEMVAGQKEKEQDT